METGNFKFIRKDNKGVEEYLIIDPVTCQLEWTDNYCGADIFDNLEILNYMVGGRDLSSEYKYFVFNEDTEEEFEFKK